MIFPKFQLPKVPKGHDIKAKIQCRLGWQLMISYLIVIVVGFVILALVAGSVIPGTYEHHLEEAHHTDQHLTANLLIDFRSAISEALLLSFAATLASAILVSFLISQRMVTPIRQMMQASRRIATGHYRERVEVASDDELGQLASSFNQMAATLEQTETIRRDLIANVTHELRTPLSSIKGYMEALIDGVLPAQPDIYQQVYHEADRLQRLVNDLQELSRLEADAFELDDQSLDMAELIEQTAARLRPQFEEKGVSLETLAPDLPPVLADKDRMSQVLLNLVGNALQYTPSGGRVTVTAGLQPPTPKVPNQDRFAARPALFVVVKDTGVGISAHHLPHLFTRFYRVDKSRSRVGGGSGIGLTIAKHLVEAHRGHIWAESEGEGQGSLFGFSLPLA